MLRSGIMFKDLQISELMDMWNLPLLNSVPLRKTYSQGSNMRRQKPPRKTKTGVFDKIKRRRAPVQDQNSPQTVAPSSPKQQKEATESDKSIIPKWENN